MRKQTKAGITCAFLISTSAMAQQGQTALPWVDGPTVQSVKSVAEVSIPKGTEFLDQAGTSELLRQSHNPPSSESYTIADIEKGWFAIIHYDETGHVADNETIDADKLLETLKSDQIAGNERRSELGFEKLFIDGWSVPPHYDVNSNNLEWGLRIHDETGHSLINYTTRLLGREGVIASTLVTSPESFDSDLESFKTASTNLKFLPDQNYSQYREGDKTAEYGIAALVAGGAAAAVVKSGAGKGLFKLIAIGVLAAFAAVFGFFKRLFGGASN